MTHVVFGAYVEKDTPAERSAVNVALLRNLLDAVEASSPGLQHVTIYQGGKAYGADLGPFKTPAREDDPRLMPPNFYYDQEDHLRERQKGKRWTFSILRPEAVCGYAVGNPMNLTMVIAVYAAISKELGLPLRFPGTGGRLPGALSGHLAPTSSPEPPRGRARRTAAANEIFNITNGDYFRWQFMWPRIARMFQMEVAEPVPMPLAVYMADKGPLWDEMTRKYSLRADPVRAGRQLAVRRLHLQLRASTTSAARSRPGGPGSMTASTRKTCSRSSSPTCAISASSLRRGLRGERLGEGKRGGSTSASSGRGGSPLVQPPPMTASRPRRGSTRVCSRHGAARVVACLEQAGVGPALNQIGHRLPVVTTQRLLQGKEKPSSVVNG